MVTENKLNRVVEESELEELSEEQSSESSEQPMHIQRNRREDVEIVTKDRPIAE